MEYNTGQGRSVKIPGCDQFMSAESIVLDMLNCIIVLKLRDAPGYDSVTVTFIYD